jgi:hypothetical protein
MFNHAIIETVNCLAFEPFANVLVEERDDITHSHLRRADGQKGAMGR